MKASLTIAMTMTAALLAGCVEETGTSSSSSDVPISDVDVCEAAVARETGNSQVRTLRTEFSEANNAVIVGVGPSEAPWQCLVKNGGVGGVMSLTNEGTL